MKKTISFHEFQNEFQDCRPDNFSYDGLKALFDYLEDFSEDCGIEIELDVVAICCEFSEYESAMEAAKNYNFEPDEDDDNEDQEAAALEFLEYHTSVITFDSGVIIQDY